VPGVRARGPYAIRPLCIYETTIKFAHFFMTFQPMSPVVVAGVAIRVAQPHGTCFVFAAGMDQQTPDTGALVLPSHPRGARTGRSR